MSDIDEKRNKNCSQEKEESKQVYITHRILTSIGTILAAYHIISSSLPVSAGYVS
jgi:hypothetical protein